MRLQDDLDFTTLTWVKGELDETLKQARHALEAYVEDPTDVSQMRFCATYLHQVQGTLRMVELYGAAMVSEEMESLATTLLGESIGDREEAYSVLMRGIVQLPDYLERLQSGHKDIPVVLLPLLNDLRAARGEKGLTESALFAPDLSRPLPSSASGPEAALPPADIKRIAEQLRIQFQLSLLKWLKNEDPATHVARLAQVCDKLVTVTAQEDARRMFWVAAGLLTALRENAFAPEPALKQAIGRVEREIKRLIDAGENSFRLDPPRELTRTLLYFAAHAPTQHGRIAELRQAFDLASLVPTEEEIRHAQGSISGHNRVLLDTVSAGIKEDLLRVKEALDIFLRTQSSDVGSLAAQAESLNRVADTLGMLGLGVPRGVVLEQKTAVEAVASGVRAPDESTLLDIAGALLYVESSLDDQVQHLGAGGGQRDMAHADSRKVVDALVKEAQANFAQAKQCFVAFVESSWDHAQLSDVPRLLEEVAGALRILELDEPPRYLAAVGRFTEAELLHRHRVPNGQQLDTLADALASLEYFLEALREHRAGREKILDVARQRLESLGYWPIPEGDLQDVRDAIPAPAAPAPVSEPQVVEAAQPQASEPPVEAPEVVAAPVPATPAAPATPTPAPAPAVPAPKPAAPAPVPAAASAGFGFESASDEIDEEIREVFVEEVQEEISNLDDLLPAWISDPKSAEALKPIRRVFHTLKGSGRLVGAVTLGEFSWKVENMLNRVLDNTIQPEAAVQEVISQAHAALPQLLSALKGESGVSANLEGIKAIADRVGAGEAITVDEVREAAAAIAPAISDARADQAEAERLEAERLEAERLEAERLEAERLEAERLEAERLEAERLEAERLEAERVEAERVEAERVEAERVEAERLEAERVEAERVEAERVEAERVEAERIEAERVEAEQLEAELAELQRLEDEKAEAARVESERVSAERAAAEQAEAEKRAAALAAEALAAVAAASHEPVSRESIKESAPPARDTTSAPAVPVSGLAGADPDPDGPLELPDMDEDLLDIFLEEGVDILDHSDGLLAKLRDDHTDRELVVGLQRDLHTLKGGARMAGLTPIGDLGHAAESLLEQVADGRREIGAPGMDVLERVFDRLHGMVKRVGERRAIAMPNTLLSHLDALVRGEPLPTAAMAADAAAPAAEAAVESVAVPVSRPAATPTKTALDAVEEEESQTRAPQEQIRIRADLLDRLVTYAGEVAIYRARLEQQIGAFRGGLVEMDQTTSRLREQLRRLEIETEAQIIARYQREQEESDQNFDPLELDRFSTLQQLSRALGESAADLTNLQGTLEDLTRQYETLLLQQSRVSSELQEGLMRTRMVPFDALVPRLRRIMRQTGSELGKKAQLKVEGAQGEMDRNVLDRMTAPLEHMLRNALAHGLEAPADRAKAGKPEEGTVRIHVAREASEVVIRVSDDGRGMDRDAIRRKAVEKGMMSPDAQLSDRELFGFVLESGFSTAQSVSKIAGRGVGMDVVHSEIKQLGGSLYIDSQFGKGSEFVVRLPFTLAVTQAVFVKLAETVFAVPIASVQGVARIAPADLQTQLGSEDPHFDYAGERYSIHDLGNLLGHAKVRAAESLQVPMLLARSGDLRAAICVDQVVGSKEIVVKPTGPQINSIPGIFGATVMGDGSVVVILDVAPLVRKAAAMRQAGEVPTEAPVVEQRKVPLVMVVDDSITMRKVSSRVLERAGYEVTTAKDGVDAIEKMVERVPDAMLLDIEMPRMDGYELATHMRNDVRLRGVPIIMITSRTGEKHRQRAFEIGVNRYLGKPYQEPELLRNVSEVLKESVGG